jgi:hypothetical protein
MTVDEGLEFMETSALDSTNVQECFDSLVKCRAAGGLANC